MDYIPRFIEKDMLKWKDSVSTSILLVQGARQVGKTTTIKHFIYENYKNVIDLNLSYGDHLNSLCDWLKKAKQPEMLSECIAGFANEQGCSFSNDKNTVLFLDEIQESEFVFKMLRSLRRCTGFDIIISGSFLYRTVRFFQPFGDLKLLTMHPISFEEFLQLYAPIYSQFRNLSLEQLRGKSLSDISEIFKIYCYVGGYPAVVEMFMRGQDIVDIQGELLESIYSEIRHVLQNVDDFTVLQRLMSSVISRMCREKKGDRHLLGSISKLTESYDSFRVSTKESSNLITTLHTIGVLGYCDMKGFDSNALSESERFYFTDLGMLNYLLHYNDIDERTSSGFVAENYVYKVLAESSNVAPRFGVFDQYELDFVQRSKYDGLLYGIEVKAGKNSGISVKKAFEKGLIDKIVYFKGDAEYGLAGDCCTVPLCLASKFKFDLGKPVQPESVPTYAESLKKLGISENTSNQQRGENLLKDSSIF